MRKFSVLLADDEELALLGLAEGVEWENLNIENIYKCRSKESAIQRLRVSPVDIIITDIEMPNGNGIELIRWVRENKPEIKSIFTPDTQSFLMHRKHYGWVRRIFC